MSANKNKERSFMAPERKIYKSLRYPFPTLFISSTKWIFAIIVVLLLAAIVVPWQQTSRGEGKIIAYDPNEREHPITALVGGRIKTWYVNDGDFLLKGDKVVEIVDNDPLILQRLQETRDASLRQLEANKRVAKTAKINYDRQYTLFEAGLSARKEYEKAKIEYEKLEAKVNESEAKLAQVDIKLSQQNTNLIVAPQDGTITELKSGSLSTIVKKGEILGIFVPQLKHPAVVMYIDPNDMQFVYPGRKVRLQFQGWPSVQFSGWPSVAVGTFGGIVKSVAQNISKNDLLRLIIIPDLEDEPWPQNQYLRVGTKVYGTVLMNQVTLGFEVWRRLNNFPPKADTPPPTVKLKIK